MLYNHLLTLAIGEVFFTNQKNWSHTQTVSVSYKLKNVSQIINPRGILVKKKTAKYFFGFTNPDSDFPVSIIRINKVNLFLSWTMRCSN